MHLIPKSNSAQGACSLDDPQPKFFPVIKIDELSYGLMLSTNSSIFFLVRRNAFQKTSFFQVHFF